jgi:hypothetical protein
MKFRLSLFAALAFVLAACAGQTPQVSVQSPVVVTPGATVAAPAAPQSQLAQLQAFTLADLKAANADALAQSPPDVTSSQCYSFLIGFIPTLPSAQQGQTVGAVMAFQKLRDLKNGVTNSGGALKSLNLACAPLVIDVQSTVNLLALQIGGTAAGASVGLPIVQALP